MIPAMGGILEFTVLGCGSSSGVPAANGDWGKCDPHEPRNRRSRCSLLVRRRFDVPSLGQSTTVLIDTAPEFRAQAISSRVERLDAVLFTHAHADQLHGIDDIRSFYLAQKARISCWADPSTINVLRRRFGYVFEEEGGYPPMCDLHELPRHGQPWQVDGCSGPLPIVTFDQDHGSVRSVGYRFGNVAYSSDVVALDEKALRALANLDVWIVDALRRRPHWGHAHLDRTLEWIDQIKPRRAILTNMHNDMDYAELNAELPPSVEPGYDGLTFQHDIGS